MILVSHRHGLRAVEICDLDWSQVEFDRTATLHVRCAKNGKPAAHPIRGDELRALRELQRHTSGGYAFETERGAPFTTDAVNSLGDPIFQLSNRGLIVGKFQKLFAG